MWHCYSVYTIYKHGCRLHKPSIYILFTIQFLSLSLSLYTCTYLLSICSVSYLLFLLWYTAVCSSLLDRHQVPWRISESSLRKVSRKSFKVRKVDVETLQFLFQWKIFQLRQHTILNSQKWMMQCGTWLKSTWRWFPTENPTTPV